MRWPTLDPPLTEFQVKSEIFISHFAKQCPLLKNKVEFPLSSRHIHGHDKISAHVLKLSDKATCNTLYIIYAAVVFSTEINNIVRIHEKESKQLVKNYRPISLFPLCGKIFERLIYAEMYPYLTNNNLISSYQLGFKGGDSCINQILSIMYEIYKSFDEGFELRR